VYPLLGVQLVEMLSFCYFWILKAWDFFPEWAEMLGQIRL
jgi:hypothetical protein